MHGIDESRIHALKFSRAARTNVAGNTAIQFAMVPTFGSVAAPNLARGALLELDVLHDIREHDDPGGTGG